MTNHADEARRIMSLGFSDDGHCAITHALLAIADAIRDTQHTCGNAQPDIPESPCALTTGHRGPHTDREGDTW